MGEIRLEPDAVLDTASLKAHGVTAHHITRLTAQGRLHRVEPGVYTTSPPTGILLLRALAHRRPHLVYSGRTAFELHSGQEPTPPFSARVPHRVSNQGTAQLNIRQSRVLRAQKLHGLRVVTPLAAVADYLEHDEEELVVFLEQEYRTRFGRQRLERHLDLLPRVPRRLRQVLGQAAVGGDSDAERSVFRALKQRGVTVRQNEDIGGYLFDGVIPAARVIVEIDGYAYHSAESRETFVVDRWKANYATRRGYRVLRYSGSCVLHHLDQVVEQILAAVEDRPGCLRTEARPVWKWHNTLLRDGPWEDEMAQ